MAAFHPLVGTTIRGGKPYECHDWGSNWSKKPPTSRTIQPLVTGFVQKVVRPNYTQTNKRIVGSPWTIITPKMSQRFWMLLISTWSFSTNTGGVQKCKGANTLFTNRSCRSSKKYFDFWIILDNQLLRTSAPSEKKQQMVPLLWSVRFICNLPKKREKNYS